MSAEDLENYETDAQMALYREYKDVMSLFSYAVETDRRFYLAKPGGRHPARAGRHPLL